MFQPERELTKEIFTDGDFSLPYRFFMPLDYDPSRKYPLLLFLHGAGERGSDNEIQLKHVIGDLLGASGAPAREAFLIVPQCPAGMQWVERPFNCGVFHDSTNAASRALEAAVELVRQVIKRYSIDEEHVYAMGISMGGYATWYLLGHESGLFAGGVPICGGGDPATAPAIVPLAVHAFHSSDDNSVPVLGSRKMVKACIAAGGKRIRYTEYNYAGHGSWIPAAKTPGLLEWLFDQARQQ